MMKLKLLLEQNLSIEKFKSVINDKTDLKYFKYSNFILIAIFVHKHECLLLGLIARSETKSSS